MGVQETVFVGVLAELDRDEVERIALQRYDELVAADARDVAREVLAQIDAQGITQESLNGWAGSIVDVNNDVQRAQIRFMKNNQVPNKPTQDAINRAVK